MRTYSNNGKDCREKKQRDKILDSVAAWLGKSIQELFGIQEIVTSHRKKDTGNKVTSFNIYF